jgi:hypothetical protein
LFFISILFDFIFVTLTYNLFNKIGVYAWIALATVIANIEVLDYLTKRLTLAINSRTLETRIIPNKKAPEGANFKNGAAGGIYLGFAQRSQSVAIGTSLFLFAPFVRYPDSFALLNYCTFTCRLIIYNTYFEYLFGVRVENEPENLIIVSQTGFYLFAVLIFCELENIVHTVCNFWDSYTS